MDVLVAGAHGKIGQRLVRRLADAGHTARGLIRKPEQAARIEELGGTAVVADLEADFDPRLVTGADAIVFAAGAGPGSGAARKETMDLGGAVKLIDAAREHGVHRYVIVSSFGAGDPEGGAESMRPYMSAKARADEALATSGLDYTIVRPGGLTDEPGRGTVSAAPSLGGGGQITRDDVAETVLACLEDPRTIGQTFELFQGDVPIREALAQLPAAQ